MSQRVNTVKRNSASVNFTDVLVFNIVYYLKKSSSTDRNIMQEGTFMPNMVQIGREMDEITIIGGRKKQIVTVLYSNRNFSQLHLSKNCKYGDVCDVGLIFRNLINMTTTSQLTKGSVSK